MQRLAQLFAADYGDINCAELTELSFNKPQAKDVLKYVGSGRILRCFTMSGSFSQTTYREINAAMDGAPSKAPEPPVSCAALLLQRVGAPELHQTMAAGFAGGIGLSGGGCGALGAAIWLISLKEAEAGALKLNLASPTGQAAIERYLAAADYQYECAAVVGRQFSDVHDHATYLRGGGCEQIIEALAAPA